MINRAYHEAQLARNPIAPTERELQRARDIASYPSLPKKKHICWDATKGRFHIKFKGKQNVNCITPTGADMALAQMKVWYHIREQRKAQEELEQATINNQTKPREL